MSSAISLRRLSDYISPAYLQEQKILHARPNGYGGKGDKWAAAVVELAVRFDAGSVLDYGCGEGSLATTLRRMSVRFRVSEYDPAMPGKDELPSFADLVVSTDVIEHVEPDRLDAVLAHLKLLARKAVFVVVATRPSGKVLSDGRNAHLILEQDAWWTERFLQAGFQVNEGPKSPLRKVSREFVAVLTP